LVVTALGLLLAWAWRWHAAGHDPVLALRPGALYAPPGWPHVPGEGYDGQFTLYLAVLPWSRVAAHLDVPAYRAQRILLPLLVRPLAQGDPARAAWWTWAWLALGHLVGTAVVGHWVRAWGRSSWWSLAYGLWPGLLFAFQVGLPEPLSLGLAWLGLAWGLAGRFGGMAAWLTAAALAKETALLVWAAALLAWWPSARARRALGVGLGVWLAWQAVLWWWFDRPGIGSGGAGATGWAWFPLGGLWAVGAANPRALAVYLLVFGPAVLWPVFAGLVRGWRAWRQGCWHGRACLWSWLAFVHSAVALFLPFSTWREPFAILRVLSPTVSAYLFLSLYQGRVRELRYLVPFWAALAAFLFAR